MKWISVKDMMPDYCEDVLVKTYYNIEHKAWYSYRNRWLSDKEDGTIVVMRVTHWKRLKKRKNAKANNHTNCNPPFIML